jgi:hypothetical protein
METFRTGFYEEVKCEAGGVAQVVEHGSSGRTPAQQV